MKYFDNGRDGSRAATRSQAAGGGRRRHHQVQRDAPTRQVAPGGDRQQVANTKTKAVGDRLFDDDYPRRATMSRQHRKIGIGLWSCGNCGRYQHALGGNESCQAMGVQATAAPCALDAHLAGGGKFEPLDVGSRVANLRLDLLDADEALIASVLARRRFLKALREWADNLEVGATVTFTLDGHEGRGVVVRASRRVVHVARPGGEILRLRPEACQPLDEDGVGGLVTLVDDDDKAEDLKDSNQSSLRWRSR